MGKEVRIIIGWVCLVVAGAAAGRGMASGDALMAIAGFGLAALTFYHNDRVSKGLW